MQGAIRLLCSSGFCWFHIDDLLSLKDMV